VQRVASGYCHFSNIPKELANLPSVQPTKIPAKWIKEDRGGVEYTAVCSECGKTKIKH